MTEEKRQYLFVLGQLTAREIKRKYSRSYLGILWSVLNPLLSMTVLSLVFSQFFRRSIEQYPIYYLTGYLVWQTFTGATNGALTTLGDNKALLLKVRFPMEIFVLARVYTAFLNLGYSLAAYGVLLAFFQIRITWTILAAPFWLLGLFFFSLGISYILAAAYVFFGDVKHLYFVALTLWMYLSGIFYPAEQLTGGIRLAIESNPLYMYIHGLRELVMYGTLPGGWEILALALWTADVYLAGCLIFQKSKRDILLKL